MAGSVGGGAWAENLGATRRLRRACPRLSPSPSPPPSPQTPAQTCPARAAKERGGDLGGTRYVHRETSPLPPAGGVRSRLRRVAVVRVVPQGVPQPPLRDRVPEEGQVDPRPELLRLLDVRLRGQAGGKGGRRGGGRPRAERARLAARAVGGDGEGGWALTWCRADHRANVCGAGRRRSGVRTGGHCGCARGRGRVCGASAKGAAAPCLGAVVEVRPRSGGRRERRRGRASAVRDRFRHAARVDHLPRGHAGRARRGAKRRPPGRSGARNCVLGAHEATEEEKLNPHQDDARPEEDAQDLRPELDLRRHQRRVAPGGCPVGWREPVLLIPPGRRARLLMVAALRRAGGHITGSRSECK